MKKKRHEVFFIQLNVWNDVDIWADVVYETPIQLPI